MKVTFENIEKRYGDTCAVKDLNLTVHSGALHFFLGPSGCGKTTTLRMLAGLEKPTNGKIFFNNKDVTHMPAAERGIGMVFQNYALWPHMTVRKNIEYGLKLRKLPQGEMLQRMKDVIAITQLGGYEERLPGQLSGGQQQRVALARALAVRPSVLLLDEPLSNLDAKLRLEMRDNISRIHKQTGITTIYVTHDQKEALSMGTNISVMRKGELIQTSSPRNLYHHPESAFIANFIGETNLFNGQVKDESGDMVTVETPFGNLVSARRQGATASGENVCVAIRPEAIEMLSRIGANQKVDNKLSLQLTHSTYLGESEQLEFSTKSKEHALKASVFHAPEEEIKEGSYVDIAIAPEDIMILPYEEVLGGT